MAGSLLSDAGVPVELASSGAIHDDLISAGSVAQSGSRNVKPGGDEPRPTIDLLVQSLNGRFSDEVRGERGRLVHPNGV